MVTKTAEVFKLTSGKAPFVYEIYQNARINVGVNGPTGKTISSLQFDMSQSSFGLAKCKSNFFSDFIIQSRIAQRRAPSSNRCKFFAYVMYCKGRRVSPTMTEIEPTIIQCWLHINCGLCEVVIYNIIRIPI